MELAFTVMVDTTQNDVPIGSTWNDFPQTRKVVSCLTAIKAMDVPKLFAAQDRENRADNHPPEETTQFVTQSPKVLA